MKKKYIAPATLVIELQNENLVCQKSTDYLIGGDSNVGNNLPPEAPSRRGWDEYEQ